MKKRIRVGSRESKLAVMQTESVMEAIKKFHSEVEFELITFKTTGDKILDKTLDKIGGKGLFVKELDQALYNGTIDIAVHSLKDMPMEEKKELPILAYVKRGDPRDVIVFPESFTYRKQNETCGIQEILSLAEGTIGTSSARRQIQLKKLCSKIRLESIRGNIVTRLDKLERKEYGALVLAGAGLIRAGYEHRIHRYFSKEEMIPAAGQGILAVQGREDFDQSILKEVDHKETRFAAMAERMFIRTLEGGCSSPIAAFAQMQETSLCLKGLYYKDGFKDYFIDTIIGNAVDCEKIGYSLALRMKKEGEKNYG